jgi:hypothetical protein
MRFKTFLLEFFGQETTVELSRKEFPEFGYYSKTEKITYPGSKPFTTTSFYTIDGDYYIGDEKWAKMLTQKRGLTKIQTSFKDSKVANIGFNEKEQKWYGWSHRAMFGFGIGDKIFKEQFGNDHTKFSEHGDKKIETLSDAKLAAGRFAEYVS